MWELMRWQPRIPPSVCYFPGPCDFTGSKFSYVLADGTSTVFQNFSGTFHSVSSSVYEIDGTASGTDSTRATVSVVVVYQFRAWPNNMDFAHSLALVLGSETLSCVPRAGFRADVLPIVSPLSQCRQKVPSRAFLAQRFPLVPVQGISSTASISDIS